VFTNEITLIIDAEHIMSDLGRVKHSMLNYLLIGRR
jgi:hypothetical protein